MIKKKIFIVLYTFLLLQIQIFSPAIADTCKNFYNAVSQLKNVTFPSEMITDSGIYFDYKWDQDKKEKIIKRNKNNFPIVRISLVEKKLIPGTVIKSINDQDLSKKNDDDIYKLVESSLSAKIEFFDENKINKIKLDPKSYEAIFFTLDSFVLNSIHEIEAKDGFFAMDYSSKLYYERTDLKNIGNNLKDESCPINDIIIDKQLFHPETNIKLLQFEKDEDKIEIFDHFQYEDDLTWLDTRISGLAKVRTIFDFTSFPFDTQKLKIQYSAGELLSNENTLFLITPDNKVFKNLINYKNFNYLMEWTVLNTEIYSELLKTEDGYKDTLNLVLEIERNPSFYIFKIIIPVLLILAVAWYVLWIPTKEIESRLTTSIVALLSLIAYNFVIQDDVPKLDYLTSLDHFILLSYFFCAVPIFTTIRLSRSIEKSQKRATRLNQIIRKFGFILYLFASITIFYPTL